MANENENIIQDVEIPTTVIIVNNVDFPNVRRGNLSIEPIVKYNEYVGEDGSSTIEEVNTSFIQGSLTYKALQMADLSRLYNTLTTVSTVRFLDPTLYDATSGREQYRNMVCLIDKKKLPYIFKDEGLSVWGMQFAFRQIKEAPLEQVSPLSGEEVPNA